MRKSGQIKVILLLFSSIFLFACVTYVSAFVTKYSLINKGLSLEEIDNIELTEILGYVIAGLFLTVLINKIDDNKARIISSIILMIGLSNLFIIEDRLAIKINYIFISFAYYIYITVTIIKILEYLNNYKYFAFIIFVLLWVAGYFLFYLLIDFLKPALNGLLFCALFYCLIIIICLQKEIPYKNTHLPPKFSFLVESIELQILTGFMVSYITFEILWHYEEFALSTKLSVSNIDLIMQYMFASLFFLIMPIILLLKIINKYLANLILIIILLISLILLPNCETLTENILVISTIGICLCVIFICNILILSDKFEEQDFRVAFTIYLTICAIGMYSGALSSNIPYKSCNVNETCNVNTENFLFSAFSVVGTFVLYYLWYFFRRKLYRL